MARAEFAKLAMRCRRIPSDWESTISSLVNDITAFIQRKTKYIANPFYDVDSARETFCNRDLFILQELPLATDRLSKHD